MLMDKLLKECRTTMTNCDFEKQYDEVDSGSYYPHRLIDFSLCLIFLMVEKDQNCYHKELEQVQRGLVILRSSLSTDDEERFPMTVLNLKHIISTLESVWEKVKDGVDDKPHHSMYC